MEMFPQVRRNGFSFPTSGESQEVSFLAVVVVVLQM